MKISRINRHASVPKPLFEADVPAKILFWSQTKIISKNLVLAARRTEPGCDTRVQRRVRPVDLVAASEAIRPHVAKLIEVIEAPASDEDQVFDWRERRLQKSRNLLGVIAHKGWLRSKNLKHERAFLSRVEATIEKS